MARSVRARIETRSARARLSGRKDPYWQKLERGLSVGYHRPLRGGTGTWWGRVLIAGRYKIESIATADDHDNADGERILNWPQAQAAIRAWAARQTGVAPLTVEAACRDYIADLRARKGDKAARGVEGRLRKHLWPVLGSRRLAELTAVELTSWRNGMVVESDDEEEIRRSRDTANRVLMMAKAVFNLAFHSGRVADDRAWRRVKQFRGVGESRKIILGEVELQLLVDAAGPGLRELILVGAWTGCRLGELTSRRVRDFDATASMLAVSGKTGPREIYLPPAAAALLRQLVSGKRADDWLLTTGAGGRWTPSLHERPFAAAVAKAGLDPATTFYSLRHSYISRALVAGIPTKAVASHCGTSAAMVERFYAKFISSDQQRYAALAAPQLRVCTDEKVVALRPGGVA
jgi:integrase